MGRSKRGRRLVVEGQEFGYSVSHEHQASGDRYHDCRDILAVRRVGSRGLLRVVFAAAPGRLVRDGWLHSGQVRTREGAFHNLHRPGTILALLDAARAAGWCPGEAATTELDGWALLNAVATRGGHVPPE